MSILLKNCTIVTQNKNRDIIHGDIFIEDYKISDINNEINEVADEIMDMGGSIVTPVFINSHLHLGETIFRSFVDGLNLREYINFTEKINRRIKHEEIRKDVVNVTLLESLKNGVSTICTARSWEEAKKFNFKGIFGYPLMKSDKLKKYYDFEIEFDKIYNKFNDPSFKVGFWIHSLNFVDSGILETVSQKIRENKNIPVMIHVDETKETRKSNIKEWGTSEIETLEKYNLLNKNTILVHCIYSSEEDLDIVKRNKANVCLCPVSNLKLKNDVPKIERLLEREINASLATDGLATNNSLNLLETAKFSGLLWSKNDLSHQSLFDMITTNPAKSTGMGKIGGSIEIGKDADLLIFDHKISNLYPNGDIISNLIYSYTSKPSHVMVDGRFLVKDYKIVNFDEKQLVNNFKSVCDMVWNTKKV